MKKVLKLAGYAVLAGLIVAQFFRPERSNPPVDAGRTVQAHLQVPANVEALLQRACQDCHSHNTSWPWYSNVAPVSWFVAEHVHDGRRHLNFSDWAKYDAERADHKLEELIEMVEQRAMPLPSYLPLHAHAKLSDDDVRVLAEWAKAERARMKENAAEAAP
jgi:cytochrome c553